MTLVRIVVKMALDIIIAFVTFVEFVIPLVVLPTSSPLIWRKEHLWSFSMLQRGHLSNVAVKDYYLYIYIKRLGMFPFKVQLFQGCKSETESINTKSVVQHVLSGHIVGFATHTSTVCIRYQALLAAYYKAYTKYCWRHITKRFELNPVCKSFKRFTYRNLYSVMVALSRVGLLGSLNIVSEMNEIVNCIYNKIYE
jgi:hypothetical protein